MGGVRYVWRRGRALFPLRDWSRVIRVLLHAIRGAGRGLWWTVCIRIQCVYTVVSAALFPWLPHFTLSPCALRLLFSEIWAGQAGRASHTCYLATYWLKLELLGLARGLYKYDRRLVVLYYHSHRWFARTVSKEVLILSMVIQMDLPAVGHGRGSYISHSWTGHPSSSSSYQPEKIHHTHARVGRNMMYLGLGTRLLLHLFQIIGYLTFFTLSLITHLI